MERSGSRMPGFVDGIHHSRTTPPALCLNSD